MTGCFGFEGVLLQGYGMRMCVDMCVGIYVYNPNPNSNRKYCTGLSSDVRDVCVRVCVCVCVRA